MPATSIRWQVARYLLDLARSHGDLDGVQIFDGWPGDKARVPEMMWVEDIDSDVSIPVMTGGRTHRDDRFEITLSIRVVGRRDRASTVDRIDEIAAAIEDIVADSSTLHDFDGVVSAEVTRERSTSADTPSDGPLGFGQIVVFVHTRLT